MTKMEVKTNNRKMDPEAAKAVGYRLAQIRMKRGYTQSELSRIISIPQSLISDYELGRTRMHAEVLTKFSLTLDISVDELLGLKPSTSKSVEPPGVKILRRVERLLKLPKSIQSQILDTMDLMIDGAQKK